MINRHCLHFSHTRGFCVEISKQNSFSMGGIFLGLKMVILNGKLCKLYIVEQRTLTFCFNFGAVLE